MKQEENEKGTFSETRAETVRTIIVGIALIVNTITCVFAILYYTGNL
jgi:hypothetical protein